MHRPPTVLSAKVFVHHSTLGTALSPAVGRSFRERPSPRKLQQHPWWRSQSLLRCHVTLSPGRWWCLTDDQLQRADGSSCRVGLRGPLHQTSGVDTADVCSLVERRTWGAAALCGQSLQSDSCLRFPWPSRQGIWFWRDSTVFLVGVLQHILNLLHRSESH